MTQVNHGEGDMMRPQEVNIFPVKPDEQRTEFIDPGEATFVGKATSVNVRVEQAVASTLGRLAIALVLGNVRDNIVIEADLSCRAGIKGTIGVEVRAGDRQPQALQSLERGLKMGFQVERIVVIARNDACRCHDVSVCIGDGQDVARFRTLASLVGHTLTAFLGNGVTAIQIQVAHVKVVLHRLNAGLPDFFQAPVGIPLAEVIVHRLPTDFFFVASFASGAIGNWSHWQPVCELAPK